MALAQQATQQIHLPLIGDIIGCHAAVWFWAAREAQGLGLSAPKSVVDTMGNVVAIRPQEAMLGLVRSGTWDFSLTPATPPVGSVLRWLKAPTHSAVVSAPGQISGYNQVEQFPGLGGHRGYATEPFGNLGADQRVCDVISEAAIVRRAGAFDL